MYQPNPRRRADTACPAPKASAGFRAPRRAGFRAPRRAAFWAPLLALALGGCCGVTLQKRWASLPTYALVLKEAPGINWGRIVEGEDGQARVREADGALERRKWRETGRRQAANLREQIGRAVLKQADRPWRWVTSPDADLQVTVEIDSFVLWKRSFSLRRFAAGLVVPVPGAAFVMGFPVKGGQLTGRLLVRDCQGELLAETPLTPQQEDESAENSDHPWHTSLRIGKLVVEQMDAHREALAKCIARAAPKGHGRPLALAPVVPLAGG